MTAALAEVSRRLRPVNKAPAIATVTLSLPDSGTDAVTGTVVASDPEGTDLTLTATTSVKGTVSISPAGVFTYTPLAAARHAAAKIGATPSATKDTVTVTVADDQGVFTNKALTVAISPQNTAPVATTPTVGTPDKTTGVLTGIVSATDAENDPLTYTAPTTTSKGTVTFNSATGEFTYTPNAAGRTSVAGIDTFTVTAADNYGGFTPVAVSVPVAATEIAGGKLTYAFNYGSGASEWTPDARSALETVADQLANYFVVTKPVTLVFDVNAENAPDSSTLASASSDLAGSFTLVSDSVVDGGIFNTEVQDKIITGVDPNGAEADGVITVNFANPWAYGDSVSADQYDFQAVMLHELLHAFGFFAIVDQPGNNTGRSWSKFDGFIATSSQDGTSFEYRVIDQFAYEFTFKAAFDGNLIGEGGGLFFVGPNAVAAYGGPVPLYTPNPWEDGSSVSHLDDTTFTGANTQLMNAATDTGLGSRTPSAIELAILKDIGYTVNMPPAASTLLFMVVFIRRRRRGSAPSPSD